MNVTFFMGSDNISLRLFLPLMEQKLKLMERSVSGVVVATIWNKPQGLFIQSQKD